MNVLNVSVTTPVYPLLTGDSYLITHLHPYNEYTISVTAVNSAGESGSSDPINTTTLQSCKFICYSDCLQYLLLIRNITCIPNNINF